MPPSLRQDTRAIEGLPIRLVIALVVGAASLGVMMNVLSGLDTMGVTELDTRPEPEIIEPGGSTVAVTVVDADGRPVADATVVASGGTAALPELATGTTGQNGTVELELAPRLGPNQRQGTIELEVKPPDGEYTDRRENTAILVIDR